MAKILELNDILHVFGESAQEEPLLQYKKTTEISTDAEATASNGLYRKFQGSYWKRQATAFELVQDSVETAGSIIFKLSQVEEESQKLPASAIQGLPEPLTDALREGDIAADPSDPEQAHKIITVEQARNLTSAQFSNQIFDI